MKAVQHFLVKYLTESRFIVYSRASIAMPASSNFEVEWTINSEINDVWYKLYTLTGSSGIVALIVTYLSFSVPKIEARYSAIFQRSDWTTRWNYNYDELNLKLARKN